MISILHFQPLSSCIISYSLAENAKVVYAKIVYTYASSSYLPRLVESKLSRALAQFPIVILDGARATGKTTTASRLAASVVRFPKDLDSLRVNPEKFLRSLTPPVLIDEWQLAGADFLWTLKNIVDEHPRAGSFILTGSVEPATYGPTYPLTGRALQVTMWPMTAGEMAGAGNEPTFLARLIAGDLPDITAGKRADFDVRQLFNTGFPAARSLEDPAMFLESYAATVAQRAGDEGRDASRFYRTASVLATLEGQAVPDQRIWEAADINKATWKNYQDLLARTWLSANLQAFSSNRLARITDYPKRFFCDTALALALAKLTPAELERDHMLLGRYFESYAVAQLRPQASALSAAMYHVRTSGGAHEVDLLIETSQGMIACEAKAVSSPTMRDAKHLIWLQEKMGDRFLAGLVIHTGADVRELAKDIYAIPIALIAYRHENS